MAKRKFSRVPALSEPALEQASLVVSSLRISRLGKQQLQQIIRAAANPASEQIDVVVGTLAADRREVVTNGAKAVKQVDERVRTRASRALLDMPDAEWEQMVERSQRGE